RPGCFDPKARLEDMDVNWVEASLSFPTFPRFCGQTFLEAKDRDLAHACVVELSERACDRSIVPFRASPSARRGEARAVAPGRDPRWLQGGQAARFAKLGRPLFAAVIPFTPAHGLDVLVDAFARLRAEHREASLVVLGETSWAFPARREFKHVVLDRLAGEARHAIEFAEETDGALKSLLSLADALIHPVLVPGSGTSIVEALHAGVPVVASDLPAFREWLEDGRDALLVPAGDAAALAEAALAATADRGRAQKLVAQGRALAQELFTLERLADELEALLRGS
ncbi:MAG TPA: glycosyltransferase, partial [Planctomycetota bacterium]|nr:glycosyltransferase [Planctomycetota bacterium]